MKKLTAKARDSVETLLNTYSALCSAEGRVGKRGQDFGISVSNEANDSDFVSVSIDSKTAADALRKEKTAVAAKLKKHGVDV